MCEQISEVNHVKNYLNPMLDNPVDHKIWIQLSCSTYFYMKEVDPHQDGLKMVEVPVEVPPIPPSRPPTTPPHTEPVVTTIPNSTPSPQPVELHDNVDPNFGKHWSDSYKVDIVATMNNKKQPAAGNIPASFTEAWDLQKDNGYEVLERGGKCEARSVEEWGNKRNPLVAICTGVTSRKADPAQLNPTHLALFVHLLPSIIATFDCDVDYLVTIGFDKGDAFYDTEEGQKVMVDWLAENMAKVSCNDGCKLQARWLVAFW